jgi:hypothetical protein
MRLIAVVGDALGAASPAPEGVMEGRHTFLSTSIRPHTLSFTGSPTNLAVIPGTNGGSLSGAPSSAEFAAVLIELVRTISEFAKLGRTGVKEGSLRQTPHICQVSESLARPIQLVSY